MNINEAIATVLVSNDPCVVRAGQVIRESHEKRSKILKLVQEALSQLRVDMKYLIFDLECTRKERDELKGV